MIDAKHKFREGFIMTLRPFDFAELQNPIQKMTILWAYSEQPITKKVLTDKAKEEIAEIENSGYPFLLGGKEAKEEWLNEQIEKVYSKQENHEVLYEGDIVQCYVEGKVCRLYPDEYKIMNKERLFEIMQEEGYHVILDESVKRLKDFQDKAHYLKSRGVNKNTAEKWASLSFPSMVIYKPYFQLLETFARAHEIYPDKFYEEIEGIKFNN